ncbi:dipeptidase [Sphingomonas sp. CL5.1]|uniref:dipeptidase n=1 Tax=Sphingomonas sp. CL5.1 TaxID=2653203 RepID=UPI0015836FE7|nr:membrane dipeptidase [Sphingomonas sp. CL5.1]QKR99806.1 dipeptidase [Sphingomonas sp. CL5.1]
METSRLSRRTLIRGMAAASGAVAFPMVNFGAYRVEAASHRAYPKRVVELVESSIIIDMLGPLSLDLRPETIATELTDAQVADFRASGITAFHNSFGVGGRDGYANVLRFLAGWSAFVGHNDRLFTLVNDIGDVDRAKRQNKVAVIMGLQDSDHFRTPKDVELFYQLGQRCSQLTYNSQNLIGSGCTERVDGGLSDFGVEIVKAMNAVGMLVDTSHCGDRTTLDAIEASPVPIAITHGNCRAINNHPRTKTDEAIKALGAKGGVMGITGVRNFVSATDPTTVANVVDHIDHVRKLIGPEHVGIGTDSDLYGYDKMAPDQYKMLKAGYKGSYGFRDKIDIDGFSGPLKMYNLTEELMKRGYSDADIRGVLGGNFRRLLGATWK